MSVVNDINRPFPNGSVRVASSVVTYRSDIEDVAQAARSFSATPLSTYLTIVDNCSGDDYVEALRRTVPADRIIDSGSNRGFGSGHNMALRIAPECDYYLVLNPDIVIHEGALQGAVEFMDRNPEVGLLGPRILNPDGSQEYLNKRLPTVFDLFARRFLPEYVQNIPWVRQRMDSYIMLSEGYDAVVDVPYISGCFMLFRMSALRTVGGFDENFFMYLEEVDMTRRINTAYRSVYFPGTTVTHKWSRGSHKSWRLTWVTIKSAIYYFKKWGWRLI